ncbi:class I SAM-dependent methyltransferase [Pseudomonas sp. WS 5106]|jgi:2-polyprenyl-3-methyl-5-hydroxy-6-metoxy-1,4-benzoquinol methylase|uniref:Class I SAM-dependent methyltransferase n=1 Tax=Pseudomonas cremoris TaxID=2724178 RepID=A0A7X1ASR4_9PSED|nr:class I SAM-dependent methyltransferase [Pseudomonas cremoris]MBC2382892.1 class I SAM-dependent methyltransferase [Pseudomonas cremoris]MBC2409965.1 class I SAM-dependent methyltransferase [Pseudomonas cremoris]
MKNKLDNFIEAYGEEFSYAFDNNIILNWYPQRIMKICSNNQKLLELGIGHGFSTDRFSRYFSDHVVVDGSASVIEQFRRKHPNNRATIVESYFEHFECDSTFDLIIMGFVLEHVEDPQVVLKRFKKFLSPGGSCFIMVPNGESLHRRLGHSAGLLNDMMALGQGDLELGHNRLYSSESLTTELNQAGYHIVRKEGLFLKPFTTPQLKSLNLDDAIIDAMCTIGIDYPELSCALLFEAKINTP